MQILKDLISVIVGIALRLVLFAAAIVFALFLLCAGVLTLGFVLLKALLTGRKPAFVTTFERFQQASQQFKRGGRHTSQRADDGFVPTGDVIEGQATEVRSDLALPDKTDENKP